MSELYIGLMSGTSMDGIDVALADFSNNQIQLLGHYSHPIGAQLKQKLQRLALDSAETSLDMLGESDAELGDIFADAVNQLLKQTNTPASSIQAIGSHGQTIRHRPDLPHPFSMQIADANRIAHKTGITTVADFRRRDIAAGGEGAPLTPAFHKALFSHPEHSQAVLNIGGIANITFLPAGQSAPCFGFDTGPGNMLMDSWIQRHQGLDYDANGQWAASSQPHPALVEQLMRDAFVSIPPPKSTGREHYNLQWLDLQLQQADQLSPATVQASLCAFTVNSIQYAIEHFLPKTQTLIVCGGGVHNQHLMKQLETALPGIHTHTSDHYGLAADWVEAVAFAWLARQTLAGRAGNLKEVTGAKKAVILGAIYPA